MSSFPNRLIRSQLGPKLVDNYPVENPKSELGAATFNPSFWSVAGMTGILPRAALVARWNGSSFDISHQREAWNAENDQAHPSLARFGTGQYTYTFAATYLDEDGVAVPTVLVAARVAAVVASAGGPMRGSAWPNSGNALQIDIDLRDLASANRDGAFWLEVL
jgi:hypothetical protein